MPQIRPLHSSLRSFPRAQSSFRYISNSSSLRYVRVKRPWFRGIATKCLVFGVAIYAWSGFMLASYDDILQSAGLQKKTSDSRTRGNSGSDKTNQTTHEEQPLHDSKGFFIPLGWPQLKEGKFYKASDTEWKTLVKVSKDKERVQALKDELASIVLAEASRSDLLSSMLGSPFTVSQIWLQPHWPLRAPPTYHRSGVFVTSNGVFWASYSMSHKASDRLHRSIRPFFVAHAVKDAYSVFWKRIVNKFNNSSSDDEQALSLPDQTTKTLLPSDFKTMDNLGETSGSETQLSSPSGSQGIPDQVDPNSRPHPSIFLSILQRLPLPKPGPGSDFYAASLAFKQRLNESWANESRARHNGTFSISGPVGLRGSVGFCRIEVEGEYDPITSEWVSVSMRLKDMASFKQRPLGG
ncbi:hypothetical protein BJY00DRAFT_282807, partial [Aspergillus carlsbadensis]